MNVANTNNVGGDFEDNLEQCDNNLLQKAEFAALCSFIHHFGTELGIYLTFPQLEQFLNLSKSANWKNWETLHIKLLNKLKYRARPERWEPVLGRFLVNHAASVDGRLAEAAECLVSGVCAKSSTLSFQTSPVHISRPHSPVYYGLAADIRTRLLLTLLESQFDRNQGFKDKVNLRSAVDLRFRPLGYDVWGRIYWLLKDSEINLLLYREDSVKETFQLICRTTEDMRAVRTQLENACPASTKLSEILTHCGEPALTDETVMPTSPSLTSQLHHLVQAGIASTEDEQTITAPTEVPLTNGVASPVPTPTPSPTCLVQNGLSELVKLADISSLPVVKLEPELSEDVKDSIISAEISEHMNGVPSADGEDVKSKLEADPPNSPVLSGSVKSDRDNGVNPSQSPLKTELKPEDSTEPNEQPKVTTVTARAKGRRRGRIAKAAHDQIPSDTLNSSTPTLEVRRSSRVRKPVEFLTMEAPQPKRSRHSTKLQTDLPVSDAQHHNHTQVDDSDEQPKKKRRSKKSKEDQLRKTKKKKRKRRHAKKSRGSNPWLNATSSSESDSEDDTFDRALMEHDQLNEEDSDTVDTNQQKSDALDWLDKPESDFNPDELDRDSDVDSLTQGRNFARQKRLERMRADRAAAAAALASNISADETCQVCGKAHEPEWILLCDRCDRGHHAMCLSPPLFVIPEGDWFCPRCQHATLLQALAECADQIDAEQKKQTIWKRMQERLNFVNISMTNILADGDDEGGDGESKRRARLNANVVYRDSDLSQEDSENSDEDRLRSHSEESDGSYKTDDSGSSSVRFGRRRAISRRRASQHARLVNGSTRHSGRRSTSRRRRSRWLSGSEDEDDASAPSGASFTPPAPRAARQKPIQYDLGEAFKKLEEALEDDEKYQEEKRRRRSRKLDHGDQGDSPREVVTSASPPSGPPPGRSRGKDLSNIMGPNWEEQLDLDRPSRSRKRRVGVLSSSSTDSDSDEAPVPDGRRKRRKANSDDDDDVDFQPSGDSEDLSERSDEEGEDEVEPTSESESDSSWLCAARRRRHRVGKRALRGSNRKRYKFSSKRRGRPIPRFEESEDEELLEQEDSLRDGPSRSRFRRCARAVVNYRESDNQDDDGDENEDGCVEAESVRSRPPNRRRLASSTDEDSERGTEGNDAEASTSARPQPSVSKLTKATKDGMPTRNRRVLSSSESEYEPDQPEEEEDEDDDEEPDQPGKLTGLNEKYSTANTDQSVEIKEASSPGCHAVEKSLVFAQEDTGPSTRSESGSPTALRITESSPEPMSPSVIPVERSAVRVTHVEDETSRDEESVEEDAEDLLPRHAFHARPPAAEDKSPGQTGNLPVSPDLFG